MSRRQRKRFAVGILIGILIFGGGGWAAYSYLKPAQNTFTAEDGTKLKFKTEGNQFLQYSQEGKWQELFVKGVNLGSTKPGHYPGEFPLVKEDYLRWFQQIEDLGANVIRIYTVHQPVFYSALAEYNKGKEHPLYFMQGIWSPEEQLIEQRDAFAEGIEEKFKAEIKKAVSAVYGDADIPHVNGESSGKYRANVGQYLLAWHLGTEWDPEMVKETNNKYSDHPRYAGEHFSGTEEASPFENWLAELLDEVAKEEQKYGWEHPLTFTNWVTTDVLEHPGEPLFEEDLVSVDARHIEPVNWQGGYFAAYHVYPYYPDFFRTDKTLQTIKDEQGEYNTYKAYLRKLKSEFPDLPIMITEYGVPSSLGISHYGPGGKDQGGHNEQEQGEINQSLTKDIFDEGYAGAVLFMWQDEWFKKTWNTMPFEIPADRKAYWLNVLTNEKMFGILAMEAGKQNQLFIDGKLDEWSTLPAEQIKLWQGETEGIESIQLTHDEAYLYMGITLDEPFDPSKTKLNIGTDTLPGGNQPLESLPDKTLKGGDLETLITIGKDKESEVAIAKSYDFNQRLYGPEGYWMLEEQTKDTPSFVPWKLAISLLMNPPDTKYAHPYMDEVVGLLNRGTTNPDAADYDSLTLWQYEGKEIEVRIPWMLLGFGDPSSLQVIDYSPLTENKEFQTVTTEGIRLIPWLTDLSSGNVSWPGGKEDTFDIQDIQAYSWDPWETVNYSERFKKSYDLMKETYSELQTQQK
ncbi:hypothetical protein PV403_16825 [Paenibacillus sp. GYB006]|uniref:hypothetical protein n=1 Tax=Paenibacillus sp. GYB006 TaxID=2994394 RepID=UPI002F967B96